VIVQAPCSQPSRAHYGRIFKTLHVLSYVDHAPYGAQIKGMRNLQEGCHDLARHVFQARR
jgi:TnpA family transposase